MNTDEEFMSIANELVSDQANAALDKQIEWLELWRSRRVESNQPAELRDFIQHLIRYKPKHRTAIYGLATALWRLADKDGRL